MHLRVRCYRSVRLNEIFGLYQQSLKLHPQTFAGRTTPSARGGLVPRFQGPPRMCLDIWCCARPCRIWQCSKAAAVWSKLVVWPKAAFSSQKKYWPWQADTRANNDDHYPPEGRGERQVLIEGHRKRPEVI